MGRDSNHETVVHLLFLPSRCRQGGGGSGRRDRGAETAQPERRASSQRWGCPLGSTDSPFFLARIALTAMRTVSVTPRSECSSPALPLPFPCPGMARNTSTARTDTNPTKETGILFIPSHFSSTPHNNPPKTLKQPLQYPTLPLPLLG